MLLPATVEEYVERGSIVRAIDALVRSLTAATLAEMGFAHVRTSAVAGRPPYDPCDLLGLLLWGFVRRITGSRALEEASKVNLEVIWLLRGLHPDFWTICNFRRKNSEGIKKLLSHFVKMLREEGLIGGEAVAIDGSKFRASNSKKRNFTQTSVKKELDRIEEKLHRYLDILEQNDQAVEQLDSENPSVSPEELAAKIERLQKRQAELLSVQQQMKKTGQSQVSLTDPESRRMKIGGGMNVCYNGQIAVDHKEGFIVATDVTNEANDQRQLSSMALQAKANLEVEELDLFADKGYSNGKELAECEDNHLIPYVSQPENLPNEKKGLFTKKRFRYDEASDSFVCPAGETMTFASECIEGGRKIRYYTTPSCSACPLRSRCTADKRGRRITRHEHDDAILRAAQRARARPEAMKLRKCLAEHPFGIIKRWINGGYFLTRGITNVTTELNLAALAFNLKRLHSIRSAARPLGSV